MGTATIDTGFGDVGKASSSRWVDLREDGACEKFVVPAGTTFTKTTKLWAGGKSQDVPEGTEGAVTKMQLKVMVADGSIKSLDQTNAFWKQFKAYVEKNPGMTLFSHAFEVERIGEKGDKNTKYRFRAIASADAFTSSVNAAKAVATTAMNNDGAAKIS
jgi:hypothetical protein